MKWGVEDCYGRGDGRVRRGAPLSLPSMYPGLSEKCPRFFGELFRPEGRTPSERAEPDAVLLSCAEVVGEALEQRRTISPIFLKVDERRRPYAAREERDGKEECAGREQRSEAAGGCAD